MPAAARLNDSDSSDGHIASGVSDDVIINGQPAALMDSVDSSHAPYGSPHPPHEAATVTNASSSVIVNGKGLAYVGSDLSCGHSIAAGSSDVETAA
jgi:uncharacterized Zn-binding protein involved in type VI secretion